MQWKIQGTQTQIENLAQNPPKSGKLLSAIFWYPKIATFDKSAQKWHFGCPNETLKTTFISPTTPKNDGIAFGFKRLPLLGGF